MTDKQPKQPRCGATWTPYISGALTFRGDLLEYHNTLADPGTAIDCYGNTMLRIGAYWFSCDAVRFRELVASLDVDSAIVLVRPTAPWEIFSERIGGLLQRGLDFWSVAISRQEALFLDPDSQLAYTNDPREQALPAEALNEK